MKLVIVESPAKSKTIQKYLGKDFVVTSSYGHVRDLPKKDIGVDTKHNFSPEYVITPTAKKRIADLKKLAKKANEIYFATDEDREGEAIAWHLAEVLKPGKAKTKRITFTEITQSAIQTAIKKPRDINLNLVDAQQARRILDRLVGYELSPLLWNKIRRGLSAGRVQSVAVRLIVEREREIEKFKPEEHWSLTALLNKNNIQFEAQLTAKAEKNIPKLGIKNKESMDEILKDLKSVSYTVKTITKKERKRTPPPPFITSTLQQAAYNQLGYSGKRTMMLAQQLYEGIPLGNKGPTGLITYMRTDSLNLSTEAAEKAKEIIIKKFGNDYALPQQRFFKKKTKGAQEAHEAIRPSDPTLTPDDVAKYLDAAQLKLYTLIWQRMIASQMTEARLNTLTIDIAAGPYTFRANGSTVIFDGFVAALGAKDALKETVLPELNEGDTLNLEKLDPEQHFTQPPPRYSDATLVKTLEEHGIGRPSTYAPIIDVIEKREYVTRGEDKRFRPTEVGALVNDLLTEHFPNIVDLEFTATMENNFDEIATGEKKWQPVIGDFYHPFHEQIGKKNKEIDKKKLTEEKTGEKCPECKNELVIKLGRFGKFKACSNYPECKHTEPIGEEKELQAEHTGEKCPECKNDLVIKRGRFGPFLGCSNYPECKYIKPIEKGTGVTCPACDQGEIIEKKSRRGKTFFACNKYPDCKNAYWSKPTGEKCPTCEGLLVFGAKETARCPAKGCGFKKPLEETA